MPIQTHTVEISGAHAVVRAFDQDGTQYMFSLFTAGVADVNASIANKLDALNAALAEAEFAQIVEAG